MRARRRIDNGRLGSEFRDANGKVVTERRGEVGREQIAAHLRGGRVRFVVADVGMGSPLRWIPPGEIYQFWKDEVKPHLVEPEAAERGFRLEEWPGEYCYVATEWGDEDQGIVIRLETYH
jgi:hypothetical protein